MDCFALWETKIGYMDGARQALVWTEWERSGGVRKRNGADGALEVDGAAGRGMALR